MDNNDLHTEIPTKKQQQLSAIGMIVGFF